eukprot:8772377-Pyramimonas_sp.AAC.1
MEPVDVTDSLDSAADGDGDIDDVLKESLEMAEAHRIKKEQHEQAMVEAAMEQSKKQLEIDKARRRGQSPPEEGHPEAAASDDPAASIHSGSAAAGTGSSG